MFGCLALLTVLNAPLRDSEGSSVLEVALAVACALLATPLEAAARASKAGAEVDAGETRGAAETKAADEAA